MPAFSVVIPLYNKARTIARCLTSVARQSWREFEAIVVDDGSTDGGGRIARQFPDPRFRVLEQPNRGEGAARNRGIAEARGDWIALLDADDEWDPPFLEAMRELAQRYPAAGLAASGFRRSYGGPLGRQTTIAPARPEASLLIGDYFRLARQGDFLTASSVAARRAVLEDVGLFLEGEPLGADRELWARIALRYPIAYDPRILVTYHVENGGLAHTRTGASPPFPPVVRRLRDALTAQHLPPETTEAVRAYCDWRLLEHARDLLAHRNGPALERLLKAERFETGAARLEALSLRAAARLLPIRAAALLWGKPRHLKRWLAQRRRGRWLALNTAKRRVVTTWSLVSTP